MEKRINLLDGIRSISLLLVVWFHVWEQSWLTPYTKFNPVVTRYFGITELHFHTLVSFGYTAVDMLILISAIVNFLPFARSIAFGEEWPDTVTYIKKKLIRILPSYFLCVVVMFIGALIGKSYAGNPGFMWKDLITHITFTSTFFMDTYRGTGLNGALWTVQILFIFGLILPFIALLFKKFPILTTLGLYLISIVSVNILIYHAPDLWAKNNWFTTFAGTYGSGMMICMIYYTVKKSFSENKYTQFAGAMAAFGAFLAYLSVLNQFYGIDDRPYAQLTKRFSLMLIMSLFILGIMFTFPAIKNFFGNRVFAFISLISYNLYIWHPVVCVFLKDHHIPAWNGDIAPNEIEDKPWMYKYFVIAWIASFVVAIAVTYLFELPVTRILKRKFIRNEQAGKQEN